MLAAMLHAPEITHSAAPDGTLLTQVGYAASELTEVRGRDILLAWEAARGAAMSARRGAARAFRFRGKDGGWTDLSLRDRDALCWADAVDRTVGTRTGYGVSVCLRLLALVDLLARAPWLAPAVGRSIRLPVKVARLAAESRLNDDASFDEAWFRVRLHAAGQPPPAQDTTS